MRHPVIAIVAALILAMVRPALAQDVKYEKYTLDNGMTVILHEDHSLPVGAVNIWYRVGAKDEPPGRSGFAHLFEHLMFMGTRRVPGNDFDMIMEQGGGSNNASTSFDRTNYFSSGPATLLPTLLWLDADRLEDLARTMDTGKLNKQRDVVRNEIRQNVENTPYGRAGERVYRLLYPPGHPYHNAVYGTHEDLEAADVWNVKDFFATYYVPNNASLVVAGDFDPAQVKPLIEGLFGTLPKEQSPPRPVQETAAPARIDRVIRETQIDKVQLPKIVMAFHSPAAYAEGDAEMTLAGAVLSQGKTSRLYKRLVYDDKTCVAVSAAQDPAKLGSLFYVDILARPEADLNAIERAIEEELTRFVNEGPSAEELKQRQATVELAMLSRLQSVQNRADKLNEYEFYWGEPNSFKRDLDRFRTATPESVRDWAKRVINLGQRAVIRVLPEDPPLAESPRETRPADLPPREFAPPPAQRFVLGSGVPVLLWERRDLPLVGVSVLFKPGGPTDPAGKAGLAGLTADMLSEGAGDLDALAFSEAMQSLGAQFGAGADRESALASLTVLKRNFDKAAGLMADAIRRPRLETKDWDRVKRLHLDGLRQRAEEPTVVASDVAMRTFFGADNPYGWPSDGTIATVEMLTLDDIRAAHAALFRPDHATILIAGDITPAEAKPVLERAFGDWRPSGNGAAPSASASSRDFSPPSHSDGLRVVIVDRPEAVQTVIRFIMPGVRLADEQRVPLRLIGTLLGGSFTSRLNQNLREAHGYTYGARAGFTMEPSTGYFVATSSVRADVTGESLREFLSEFARLHPQKGGAGDIPDAEAAKAAETVRTDVIDSFAGLRGLLGQAAELTASGLPLETVAADLSRMRDVRAADLNAMAPKVIDLDRAVLVLVGDKQVIRKALAQVGLPEPIEATPEGEPVGK